MSEKLCWSTVIIESNLCTRCFIWGPFGGLVACYFATFWCYLERLLFAGAEDLWCPRIHERGWLTSPCWEWWGFFRGAAEQYEPGTSPNKPSPAQEGPWKSSPTVPRLGLSPNLVWARLPSGCLIFRPRAFFSSPLMSASLRLSSVLCFSDVLLDTPSPQLFSLPHGLLRFACQLLFLFSPLLCVVPRLSKNWNVAEFFDRYQPQ